MFVVWQAANAGIFLKFDLQRLRQGSGEEFNLHILEISEFLSKKCKHHTESVEGNITQSNMMLYMCMSSLEEAS